MEKCALSAESPCLMFLWTFACLACDGLDGYLHYYTALTHRLNYIG
jgi:hypothetical protein